MRDRAELQRQVLDLLQTFRGTEPLKDLFWSKLNYDRANKPVATRGWPEPASSALAEDPTLLAEGGAGGDFGVLYSRLAKDRLSLADERIVASRLLKHHPYGLFVFSDRRQTNWHFLNVKMAEEEEKRKVFRRIAIGPAERMRTASERIALLDLEHIQQNQPRFSALDIQAAHDEAFDVEPVTDAFYEKYESVFKHVEAAIKGIRDANR
jgi:hypothetical protein